MTSFESLEQFCLTENVICPMLVYRMKLYDIIVRGYRNTPLSVPLIPAAWVETTILDKIVRLVEHPRFAEPNGALEEADAYLRELPLSGWSTV